MAQEITAHRKSLGLQGNHSTRERALRKPDHWETTGPEKSAPTGNTGPTEHGLSGNTRGLWEHVGLLVEYVGSKSPRILRGTSIPQGITCNFRKFTIP